MPSINKIRVGNVDYDLGSTREITQAEYDALPDTKNTDNIEYFITDAPAVPAETIGYNNSESGLTADNMQDAIDEEVAARQLQNNLNNQAHVGIYSSIGDLGRDKQDKTDTGLATTSKEIVGSINELNNSLTHLILDKLYPVGSIYLETTNTNPSSKLGGTWEAYGASDTYLRLGGNGTGGSNSITLSSANLPSHNHSFTPSGSVSAHQHSVGAHAHGLNSHTHSIPALSGSAASSGAHTHTLSLTGSGNQNTIRATALSKGTGATAATAGGDSTWVGEAMSAGAHTHSVSTTASTTGKASGNTANSTAFNSGSATPTFTGTAGTTGSTGSGTAITNEPKYVGVYAWKRIA